ncbi:MAG: CHAT domain-containing tetratricopeptide repeat protein [Acidobacteriota bacterium]
MRFRKLVGKRLILVGLSLLVILFEAGLEASAQTITDHDGAKARQVTAEVIQAALAESADEATVFLRVFEALRQEFGSDHALTLKAMIGAGYKLWQQGNYPRARELHEEALSILLRVAGPHHRDTITVLDNLALILRDQGDFKAAIRREEQLLEARRQTLGPEHPDTLRTMVQLAGVVKADGDYQRARSYEEQLLAIYRRTLGYDHLNTLTAEGNLAVTLHALGDFAGARSAFEKLREAYLRILGPEHANTLTAMANLAGTSRVLGDLAYARQLEEAVLRVRRQTLGPEHRHTLAAQIALASTLFSQGDWHGAQKLQAEVLQTRRRILGPEHPETLTIQGDLAGTLYTRGDLEAARKNYEEVVSASRRILGPEHPDTLRALDSLAVTLNAQGKAEDAVERCSRVLEARRRILGPEHPDTLKTMHNLASALEAASNASGARRLFEQILEIRGRSSEARPATLEEAETLFALAKLHRKAKRFELGNQHFLLALEALEGQSDALDLSEDLKTRYRVTYRDAFSVTISNFLQQGKVGEALHVLERYRAQSLLSLMRWGRPSEESVLDADLKRVASRSDALTAELESLALDTQQWADSVAEQKLLQRRLEVLRGRRIHAGRKNTPKRLPLRVEAIQHELDPGTVMLAYSVSAERIDLFVLTREGEPEVHPLSISLSELQSQVEEYFRLTLFPYSTRGSRLTAEASAGAKSDARMRLGRWLFDRLLAPACEQLATARRLLIMPDGPLYSLPFNALVRPAPDTARGWQYLVEWKPIHIAQSATVYAELRKRRRVSGDPALPKTLVAFGDPHYPTSSVASSVERIAAEPPPLPRLRSALQSAQNRGLLDFSRLPETGREVAAIGELFADARDEARIYLGFDATEERVKAEVTDARYIHFAAHGVPDPEIPANSFIALTPPLGLPNDRENGILQGWEITDTLRLDADLVVLSACATAAGPERGGEGLMSLSRAFQIAGARTVAASLWSVADDSTAELMIRFYRHLLAGEPKDEALRKAQMELIAGPTADQSGDRKTAARDFSAPYHWAAFQLIGDWQ